METKPNVQRCQKLNVFVFVNVRIEEPELRARRSPRPQFLARRRLDESRARRSVTRRRARGRGLTAAPYLYKYLIKSIDNLPKPDQCRASCASRWPLVAAFERRPALPQCSHGERRSHSESECSRGSSG